MVLLSLLQRTALAAGLHVGVPVGPHEGFEPVRFQSARQGWTLDFPGGIARVYVGPNEDAAREWYVEMATFIARQKPAPLDGLGDEAVAARDEAVLTRDGNVGVLVQVKSGARARVDRLLALVTDTGPPWPGPPRLAPGALGWTVDAPDALHVSWVGGRLSPTLPGPVFTRPPRRVVVWDALGRATAQDFDEQGLPIDTAPVRPAPDWTPPPLPDDLQGLPTRQADPE